MTRYRDDDDEREWSPDDDDDDRNAPLKSDLTDDDDAADTVACPHCRRPIWEEAEQCPHCAEYVVSRAGGATRWTWLVAGVLLAVAATWILARGWWR